MISMDTATLKERVLTSAQKHREEFSKITSGFEDRGILNSEMLAACSLAEDLGVEVFIESGRWLGQSTEILARYFENKPVIVESIEAFHDANALHVEKKLQGKKNLRLLYGDANLVVPRLVKKYHGKKIALLFDGPKGRAALDVFRLSLTLHDDVSVGFFHDMRQPTEEMPNRSRSEMDSVFPESFYTDDTDFVREFSEVDAGCDTALWRPYAIDGKKIGSYGPTLGTVVPEEKDRRKAQDEKWGIRLRMTKQVLNLFAVKTYHWIRRIAGK